MLRFLSTLLILIFRGHRCLFLVGTVALLLPCVGVRRSVMVRGVAAVGTVRVWVRDWCDVRSVTSMKSGLLSPAFRSILLAAPRGGVSWVGGHEALEG